MILVYNLTLSMQTRLNVYIYIIFINTPWQPGEAGTSSDISCAAITRGQTHAQSDQHQAWLEGWDPVA